MVVGADYSNFIFVRRTFGFCPNLAVSAVYLYIILDLNSQIIQYMKKHFYE